MCLFLVYLHSWIGLAHALCSVQAFHILLHVCMSVDFASVKVVIKESYYKRPCTTLKARPYIAVLCVFNHNVFQVIAVFLAKYFTR